MADLLPSRLGGWLMVLLATGAAVLLAGCDNRPRRVPVSGQVLVDGKPLTTGFVRLIPDENRPADGAIGPDGRFKLTTYGEGDGAVIGQHKVMVIANEPIGQTAVRWLAPKKYADYNTTDKTVSIDGPTDSLLIEVSWEGGQPFVEASESQGDVGVVTE